MSSYSNDILFKCHGIKDDLLGFLQSELRKIEDPEERNRAQHIVLQAILMDRLLGSKKKNLIILIHGIRTRAEWQDNIKIKIEQRYPGEATVIPLGYSYYDLFSFWFPFFFRKRAINKVLRKVRNTVARHRGFNVLVVAHSFGTYIISKILEKESDIVVDKLFFCGSVVREDFNWGSISNLPKIFFNDVGTRDYWPIVAKQLSWGYGCSGTFGFKTVEVKDRFFNLDHCGFFGDAHADKNLIPLLLSDSHQSVSSGDVRLSKNECLSLLAWVPFKIILAVAMVYFWLFQ